MVTHGGPLHVRSTWPPQPPPREIWDSRREKMMKPTGGMRLVPARSLASTMPVWQRVRVPSCWHVRTVSARCWGRGQDRRPPGRRRWLWCGSMRPKDLAGQLGVPVRTTPTVSPAVPGPSCCGGCGSAALRARRRGRRPRGRPTPCTAARRRSPAIRERGGRARRSTKHRRAGEAVRGGDRRQPPGQDGNGEPAGQRGKVGADGRRQCGQGIEARRRALGGKVRPVFLRRLRGARPQLSGTACQR